MSIRASRPRGPGITALCALLCLGGLAIGLGYLWAFLHRPRLTELEPAIGPRGGMLSIFGKGFGPERGDSYVSLGGIRPTASAYQAWSDTRIRLRLPDSVSSCLVRVHTEAGASKPRFFASSDQIPLSIPKGSWGKASPSISSLSAPSLGIGQPLTIHGQGFGPSRGQGRVLFSAARADGPINAVQTSGLDFIGPGPGELGYLSWTDKEIRLLVPDGAVSGQVFVQGAGGPSNPLFLKVSGLAEAKSYPSRKTYVIRCSVSLGKFKGKDDSTVLLWVAKPISYPLQRGINQTRSTQTPDIEDYQGYSLYSARPTPQGRDYLLENDYVLTVYEERVQVKPEQLRPISPEHPMAKAYTVEERELPALAPSLRELSLGIAGSETNPWRLAKSLYDWMGKNLRYDEASPPPTVLSALDERRCDAFLASHIFVSLCRSLGLPSVVISGVWVDEDRQCHPHWWSSFYVDGLGWVPVDAAFGLASQSQAAASRPAGQRLRPRDYYFGNIDNDRIAFSFGYTSMQPKDPKARLRLNSRSPYLQNILEEASPGLSSYQSEWEGPRITGLY